MYARDPILAKVLLSDYVTMSYGYSVDLGSPEACRVPLGGVPPLPPLAERG